jgi:hypothetical protein
MAAVLAVAAAVVAGCCRWCCGTAATCPTQSPLVCSALLAGAAAAAVWELLTGDLPFRGMLEGDVVIGICERQLRPAFPPGAPQGYVDLAQQCWAEDPAARPAAAQVRQCAAAVCTIC